MKTRTILAAALTATLGCAHQEAERGGSPKEDERDSKQQAPKKEPAQRGEEEEQTRPPAEEGRPELATSPEALLLPEGPRLIQEALAERGYLSKDHRSGELDIETSAALRKFQADEELARTGYPDRETVRQLGLTIAEVFKATGEGNEDPERK